LAGWGRLDSHLAQLAEEKQADLLVVGSHHRNFLEHVWHGSVSRNVLHEATCNVLCVPDVQLLEHSRVPAVAVPSDRGP
jgi:nucleotide-binding universal stress UspA family protein